MNKAGKITAVNPPYAIPGGEITIECEGFDPGASDAGCHFGGVPCRITAASSTRILAVVPDDGDLEKSEIYLTGGGAQSESFPLAVGRLLAGDLHLVANPAVDPADNALIVTRSGSRGQHLPATLFRLEGDGFLDEMPDAILNPTGIAFDAAGRMFVSNRAEGEVYLIDPSGNRTVYATGLGIATGIAFDKAGLLYVGDRSGTIFCISEIGHVETFAVLDPSVAAYHLAFGPDGRLYLTAPGLASFDGVRRIDKDGFDEMYFRGFGRPQGLAFDRGGNLYVAACYRGHHGIVRVAADGSSAEPFVAGNNVVGLCFTRKGEMVVASNNSVYAISCGIEGTLVS